MEVDILKAVLLLILIGFSSLMEPGLEKRLPLALIRRSPVVVMAVAVEQAAMVLEEAALVLEEAAMGWVEAAMGLVEAAMMQLALQETPKPPPFLSVPTSKDQWVVLVF